VVFSRLKWSAMSLQRPALQWITPMIPTTGSMVDALKFFKDEMGFSVLWEGRGMAGIGRDSISFNLVENDNRNWANNASFSIGVSNLDALFEEYRDISAQVGPLEMKSWGRREFHVIRELTPLLLPISSGAASTGVPELEKPANELAPRLSLRARTCPDSTPPLRAVLTSPRPRMTNLNEKRLGGRL
jgi:hypothetical protein